MLILEVLVATRVELINVSPAVLTLNSYLNTFNLMLTEDGREGRGITHDALDLAGVGGQSYKRSFWHATTNSSTAVREARHQPGAFYPIHPRMQRRRRSSP